MSRRAGANVLAVEQDRTRVNPVDAVDRSRDLRDTRADKTVETYDLAGSGREVHVVVFTLPAQRLELEPRHGVRVGHAFVFVLGENSADHEFDDLPYAQFLDRVRPEGLAIAHHGDRL